MDGGGGVNGWVVVGWFCSGFCCVFWWFLCHCGDDGYCQWLKVLVDDVQNNTATRYVYW